MLNKIANHVPNTGRRKIWSKTKENFAPHGLSVRRVSLLLATIFRYTLVRKPPI